MSVLDVCVRVRTGTWIAPKLGCSADCGTAARGLLQKNRRTHSISAFSQKSLTAAIECDKIDAQIISDLAVPPCALILPFWKRDDSCLSLFTQLCRESWPVLDELGR